MTYLQEPIMIASKKSRRTIVRCMTLIVLLLLLTAAIKSSLLIRDFMELKGVSLLWQVIMYGWLGTVCLAIAITYMMSV